MTLCNVVMSCGHTERMSIVGSRLDRERRVEWYGENRDCGDCYREAQEEKRHAAREAAIAAATELGLPDLTGSEKQVAWALTIRADTIATWDAGKESRPSHAKRAGMTCEAVDVCFAELLARRRSARWWIDNSAYSGDPGRLADHMRTWSTAVAEQRKLFLIEPTENRRGHTVTVWLDDPGFRVSTETKLADDFVEAIVPYGVTWASTMWTGTASGYDVPSVHVVSSLVADLIATGYSVAVSDGDVVRLVRDDAFDRPNFRRVLADGKRFQVHLEREGEGRAALFKAVTAIKGSRYEGRLGIVSFPRAASPDIVDMATRYGFDIASSAQELIDEIEQVVVAPTKKPKMSAKVEKVKANPVVGAVHADLADD